MSTQQTLRSDLPPTRDEQLVETRTKLPSLFALFILINGCGASMEEQNLIDTAIMTVQSDPPIQYKLDQFTLQRNPGTSQYLLKWTGENPYTMYEIRLFLMEGNKDLSSSTFSYYLPRPGTLGIDPERYCDGDCQGNSVVAANIAQRKLDINLDMNFSTDFIDCSTRHCVTIAADMSNIYATCKDNTECSDPFLGCHCSNVLPCTGNVVRDASDICPNPDFKTNKVGINVKAHAELTEDMLLGD